jgi:hypothetical protein
MEMQQMMEMLLKEIRANQVKAVPDREERKAERKTDKEEIRSNQAKLLATMEAAQEKAETRHKEFLARIDARWNAWREIMNANHDETVAYQEEEAHPEEEKPASVDMKPEAAEQREVPVQDATVMPVEEPKKKRRRD